MQEPSAINPSVTSFIELQSVDSTNNYARGLISANSLPERQVTALHGTGVFAHEQVAGKGQRGKIWTSEKGKNIALSIILNPRPLLPSEQFRLSATVALAAYSFFSKYAGADTRIKWPNDLYWQDRKAGGILIESVIGSREPGLPTWEWAIAGVGINVNQASFSLHLPNPVSLKQITGNDFKVVVLAKELHELILHYFQVLITGGFDTIYQQYVLHLYKKDEKVRFKKDTRVFEAVIKTITPQGKLVVQHAIEEEFGFGEVEWMI